MLTEKQYIQIPDIELECGEILKNPTIAYQTYGSLNEKRNNALLVCHALTGDSHIAGKYKDSDEKFGWWNKFIGEGKPIDTKKYFVICSNIIGGCGGSTGPASENPINGQIYGLNFPFITIKDMVKGQAALLDFLGIDCLHACVGGSMGGMQALEWAITFPERCKSFILLASSAYQSPQNIALHEVGRRAIMSDPDWQNGDYYQSESSPRDGLSIARMIAHITYLSDKTMQQKFGRRIRGKDELNFELHNEFEVESYLNYQGSAFIKRFDANSYLYITRAVDYFDYGDGKLAEALSSLPRDRKFFVISFSSDWLYPPYQSRQIVQDLQKNNILTTYCEIESIYGHDAFLLEADDLGDLLANFLANA